MSDKPGIEVYGRTTGLVAGSIVIPYVRFPGQTEFTQGTARPEVAYGQFDWSRKTGKKAYVYFTSEDGTVTSNTVIIQAQ